MVAEKSNEASIWLTCLIEGYLKIFEFSVESEKATSGLKWEIKIIKNKKVEKQKTSN